MNVHITRQLLAGVALATVLAFVAACSGTSPSMNPTSPTALAAGAAGANFSPNPGVPPPCEPPNVIDPKTGECVPPPPPPPPGDEGCTPGYWKANAKKGASEWPPYSPGQTVASAGFVAGAFGGDTLLDALQYGGGDGVDGATQILLRAAVAALLNAGNATVDYPLSVAQILGQVNAAIASGNRDTILNLAGTLDGYNNLGCPLNNS